MEEIRRLPGEEENHYIYRVCKQKDSIGTWDDVAELLNEQLGYDYGESTYRKKYAYFEHIYNANLDELTGDAAESIRALKNDLKSERLKLQALKLSDNRDLRQNSRFELFYEQVRDCVKALSDERQIDVTPKCAKSNTANNDEYILCLADIHYGAKFDVPTNSYSREEAARRLRVLAIDTIGYVIEHNINDLTVLCLGDTIQGMLRYTDLKLNEAPVVQSVVEVGRLLAEFLDTLSKVCRVRYYHVPTANHTQTRPLGSKASEIATEDLERVVFTIIEESLKNNDDVTVHADFCGERIAFDVAGMKCVATHGHTIKDTYKALQDLSNKDRVFYDYLFIGHHHRACTETVGESGGHNTEIIACPSIVGADPYADSLLVGSKAAAKMCRFNPDQGHIEDRMFILN